MEQEQKVVVKPVQFWFSTKRLKTWTWVVGTLVSLLWFFCLGVFIYTSWYANDLYLTGVMGEWGLANKVITSISDYVIRDGYYILVSVALPIGILLLESFLLYWKKYFPQNKVSNWFYRYRRVFEYLLLSAWTVAIAIPVYQTGFRDRGFGMGFSWKSWQSLRWNIVVSIIIVIVNLTVTWTLGTFTMYKITSRPDFLESHYWQRTIYFFVYLICMYLVALVLKAGFDRPSYTSVTWSEQLAYLKENHFEQYEHYLKQTTFRYGLWIDGSMPGYKNQAVNSLPGEWPWWKPGPGGWFYPRIILDEPIYSEKMFPSGHIESSIAMVMSCTVYCLVKKPYPKFWIVRTIFYTITIGYVIVMVLALCLVHGHWVSDTVFTFILALPMAFFVQWLTKQIIKGLNNFHQKKTNSSKVPLSK